MENKIIGYKLDGTSVYEKKGLGSTAMLYCEGCKKVLSRTGGKRDVFCPSCAEKKGITNKTR